HNIGAFIESIMVDLSQAPVMSRFSGENPLGWVLQAEKYFTFYNISSEHKLSWASFYLDGEALKWYNWLFQNKQLAGWDHFVDKLFIRFRGRNRDAPDRRSAFLRHFATVDAYPTRVAVIPSWSNMANSHMPQYWNAHSKNTNLNITHKMFAENPNRETTTVILTETMLTTPEETCSSVLDEDKEEVEPLFPQYLVTSSEYNSNNEARKVFDELSNGSEDAIQELNARQEPPKELTLTTETHFLNDLMNHVAPTDAANDNTNVVENEEKDNKEKVVTAIMEKAPLWIDSAFSISSNLVMIADRYRLGLAQNLETMSCMLFGGTYNQLLNRGTFSHSSDLGRVDLVLPLHRYLPGQFELDFPFDPGSSLLTTFLRVTKNCVLCSASSNFERDKFVTFTMWNPCIAPLKFQFRNTYNVRQYVLLGVAFDDRHCARYFIVRSFDMVSRLAEGIGSGINDLVPQTNLRYLPLCFCLDDAPSVWLYFYGACDDYLARTLKETEASVTKTTPVIGFIMHSLTCCVLNLFDQMIETVIIVVSNEVFLGNWNGETVSLTIENHGLGIQFFKWFDAEHDFKVNSGCTTLPNDPLSSASDPHTEISKRSRGVVAMSYFEPVSDMERTRTYPVFPYSYPPTVQQIVTFVIMIASNIEGMDYVAGLEGFLPKGKDWAFEARSLLKNLSRKVSDYILPLAKIVMYETCWCSGLYNIGLLVAFTGALRDGNHVILLSWVPDTSQAYYFNDAISIGSFQALSLGILVVSSDVDNGFSLYELVVMWLEGIPNSNLEGKMNVASSSCEGTPVSNEVGNTKDKGEIAEAEPKINGTVPTEGTVEPQLVHAEAPSLGNTWVNLFAGNRSSENGMALSYIPPEIVDGNIAVKLDKDKIDTQTKKWQCALIIYIIGDTPGYKFMQSLKKGKKQGQVTTRWQIKGQGQQHPVEQNDVTTKALVHQLATKLPLTEINVIPAAIKDKGKAITSQKLEQSEEWPALTSNRRAVPGTPSIPTKNGFQILQREYERIENPMPPDRGRNSPTILTWLIWNIRSFHGEGITLLGPTNNKVMTEYGVA
ncbi:hypothetical protein A4A49_05838, partial [Nicotiana attenuata]